jgi:hypothetical protein
MLRCLPIALFMANLLTAASFDKDVAPIIRETCIGCHNEKLSSGNLNLKGYLDTATVSANRQGWERIAARIRSGSMPPPSNPRATPEQTDTLLRYLQDEFDRLDRR